MLETLWRNVHMDVMQSFKRRETTAVIRMKITASQRGWWGHLSRLNRSFVNLIAKGNGKMHTNKMDQLQREFGWNRWKSVNGGGLISSCWPATLTEKQAMLAWRNKSGEKEEDFKPRKISKKLSYVSCAWSWTARGKAFCLLWDIRSSRV